MEPFEVLLHQEVLEGFRRTRGENRKQLNSLFSVLPENPYLQSDASYEDRKGSIVQQLRVRSYLIEYVVDDPMKEIKILELKKLIDQVSVRSRRSDQPMLAARFPNEIQDDLTLLAG